jgi:hypothetical protein
VRKPVDKSAFIQGTSNDARKTSAVVHVSNAGWIYKIYNLQVNLPLQRRVHRDIFPETGVKIIISSIDGRGFLPAGK